jgi:hypothetical protein
MAYLVPDAQKTRHIAGFQFNASFTLCLRIDYY